MVALNCRTGICDYYVISHCWVSFALHDLVCQDPITMPGTTHSIIIIALESRLPGACPRHSGSERYQDALS